MANIKRKHSYELSQKRLTLADFGYEAITTELYSIMDICGEVVLIDSEEDDALLHALDDDEEAVWEFQMAFSDLSAKSADLYHAHLSFGKNTMTASQLCSVSVIRFSVSTASKRTILLLCHMI